MNSEPLVVVTLQHSLSLSNPLLLHDAVMCPPHSCVHFELQTSVQSIHPASWITEVGILSLQSQRWQCTGKTGYKKTTQATPSLHPFFTSVSLAMRILGTSMSCGKKKGCRDGVACVVFYNLSCLYTAISTPSFCDFWHCHPYISLHF